MTIIFIFTDSHSSQHHFGLEFIDRETHPLKVQNLVEFGIFSKSLAHHQTCPEFKIISTPFRESLHVYH